MRKIITSLIAILVVTNLEAQQRTPKLVVCITVDQLRGDYIEYFYNTFGERGFKRLMNEGLVYNNIRFEFSDIDQASAFATLFTGSNPCFSGIAGDKTFDFEKEKEVSILNDPEYLGNYTKENYSPKNLFSSTIGDELKIASQGATYIPSPRMPRAPSFPPDMRRTELSGWITPTGNGLPRRIIRESLGT